MAAKKMICKSSKEAIQRGNVIELQRLMQQGENIDVVDEKFKFTPLHWASHFGALECMHWLLWHGSNINAKSKDDWTPAHIAAIRGRSKCMQALVANGADLNLADSRDKTPTHLASSHGNSQTLQEILRKGINIEARDNLGWTPAHTAAYHGRTACLQILMKWGCDVNSLDPNGNSLAHLAASEGHALCLKLVVATSKNINNVLKARNDMGEKPIDCAIQSYKKECVDYLKVIEYDADNPETAEDLSYPAHNSAFKGDLAYLQMVIETGVASIDERDERNSTPLHKAAGCGHIEMVRWLIEKGAEVTLLNRAGETARDVALRYGKLACAKLLGHDVIEITDEACDEEFVEKDLIDNDAKARAERKLLELGQQFEIAKLNYRQLGGALDDDLQKVKANKQNAKIIRGLEEQLEYERVKREKLEQQLDEMRVQVHQLHRKLEEERSKVDELMLTSKEKQRPPTSATKRNTKNKTKGHSSNQHLQPGVFLMQKPVKKAAPREEKPSLAPRPPKSNRSKNSVNSKSDMSSGLRSFSSRSTNKANGSTKSDKTRKSSSDSESDSSSEENTNNIKEEDHEISLTPLRRNKTPQRNEEDEKHKKKIEDEKPKKKKDKEEEKSLFGKIASAFKKSDSSSSSSDSD